jgi:glycosyltransferase involved in cell wall biosynthesis
MQLINGFAVEDGAGGVALFSMQLARELKRLGYHVHVCALWGYGTPAEACWRALLHAEGIATTVLVENSTQIGRDLLRAAAWLQQVVARVKPQIINSHFERGDLLALVVKLGYLRRGEGGPYLVRTMHTDQQWQTRPWLGSLLNVFVFPWLFAAEIAISQATAEAMNRRLSARLRRRRATVLYNGIAPEVAAHLATLNTGLRRGSGAPRLAVIGRLERQKGLFDFIAAGKAVVRVYPQAELWIIGTGSLLESLRTHAAHLGLASVVRFLGQRSDIPALLEQIDVVVSSSHWEGFPTVILEAMMAGVPVVATAVSGSRELVQDGVTGRLVSVRQPPELAAAVLDILADPATAQAMALRARQHAQRYTLPVTAQGYDTIYRRLLIGQSGRERAHET